MPNLGPQYDLAARIAALEDTVRRMQSNPLAQAFSMTQSDGSVGARLGQDPATGSAGWWFYQGTTTARDPNTDQHPPLMYVGEVFEGNVPVDSAVLFFSTSGVERGQIGGSIGTRFLDDKGNIAFNTDETSGEGLAEPWLPLPMPAPTVLSAWPNTNATSWGTVAQNEFRAQHPKVWWTAYADADAGTNGQVRAVIIDAGTGSPVVTGTTFPVTGGSVIAVSDTVTLPAGFWAQAYSLQVQCQVTSGTGNVYCQTLTAYGRQT